MKTKRMNAGYFMEMNLSYRKASANYNKFTCASSSYSFVSTGFPPHHHHLRLPLLPFKVVTSLLGYFHFPLFLILMMKQDICMAS